MMIWLKEIWVSVFSPENYIPHGHCYLWQTPLIWLHVTSDTFIGLAYLAIALCLVYFVRRRQDAPFPRIFALFALFIVACGFTHIAEVWTLWYPAYWLSGTIKAFTALVSVYTAIELLPIIPKALSLKSPNDLQVLNQQLQDQIQERAIAEAEIIKLNRELESRVEERTLSIAETNLQLTQEVALRKEMEESLKKANTLLAQQLKQLKQYTQTQKNISQLSDTLQICHSCEEAYAVSADLAREIFPDCQGYIFVTHPHLQQLTCIAQWGSTEPVNLAEIPAIELQDCWGLRKSSPHFSEPAFPGMRCKHIEPKTSAVTLCVPLIMQGKIVGLLHLSAADTIDSLTCDYAKTVADQLALSFNNLKQKEELTNQSYCDPLTGLYNRRYLELYLSQKLLQAQTNQETLSLILFDVDHFKAVNDHYGHAAGDKVLEYLSRFLKLNVRELDVVCRYGGEEILLVLPNTNIDQSCRRAEVLRRGISKLNIKFSGTLLPEITVSAGVVTFSEQLNSSEKLLQAADNALYQAKHQGRNCVVCAIENRLEASLDLALAETDEQPTEET